MRLGSWRTSSPREIQTHWGAPAQPSPPWGFEPESTACQSRGWPLFRRGPIGGPPSWGVGRSLPCSPSLHPRSSVPFKMQVQDTLGTFLTQRFKKQKGRGGERLCNNHWQKRLRHSMKMTSMATEYPASSCHFFLPIGSVPPL